MLEIDQRLYELLSTDLNYFIIYTCSVFFNTLYRESSVNTVKRSIIGTKNI